MKCDCHMHMILDGENWKTAIRRHESAPADGFIRKTLQAYQALGYTYLRDGGDRWGAGKRARDLAPEYGICYRTPLSPLCKTGKYGSFIGETFQDLKEYAALVLKTKKNGGDFIKIMISGLMDFDHFGVLTQPGLSKEEIREMIHIAHEEGFSVMAHANGARTAEAAAEARVDSIEHGAYLDSDSLSAMVESGVVWVPTLSTIGNLRGKGRFSETDVAAILESAMRNVAMFAAMGGLLASGSDAGAWAVPHGCDTEDPLLYQALGELASDILRKGNRCIIEKF